jgi:hypothetical protein
MSTAGPNNPSASTQTGSGDTWSNVAGIQGSGAAATVGTITGTLTTKFLFASNFGFAIPSSAFIQGITFTANSNFSSGITTATNGVGITPDGSTFFSKNPGNAWGGALTFGSSSDLWGGTWTPAQINSSTFGVQLAGTGPNASSGVINNFQITITYSIAMSWNPPTNQLNPGPINTTYVEKAIVGAAIIPVTVETGWLGRTNEPIQNHAAPQPQYLLPSTFLTKAAPFTAADDHGWFPPSQPNPRAAERAVDRGYSGLWSDSQAFPTAAKPAAPPVSQWVQPANQFVFDRPQTAYALERSFYFAEQQFVPSPEVAAFFTNTNTPPAYLTPAQLQHLGAWFTISPTAFLLGGGQSSGWFTPTEQPYPYVRVNVQEGDLRRNILPLPAIPTIDKYGQPTNLPPQIYAVLDNRWATAMFRADPTAGFLLSFTGPKVCMGSSATAVTIIVSSVTLCSDDVQFG